MSFAGRTALVTGGRRGLGGALARELARRGCRVVISSRAGAGGGEVEASLEELARAAPPGTPAPAAVAWDMAAPNADAEAARALAGLTVDILVHAAHVFSPHRLILEAKPEALARSLEQNVVAPYALARRVCRSMARARFGRVLFVGSLAASVGGVGQALYVAEKAALEGLARAFAAEFGRRGVLVNVIAPALVDTEHLREAVRADVAEAFSRRALPGRLATAEEIATFAIALVDPAQGFVTGQVIRATGGVDVASTPDDDG